MGRAAALYGTLFGGVMGMVGWMVGCYKIYGEINTVNLTESYSAICGSLPGLFFSSLAVVVLTWLYPDPSTNWDDTMAISGSDAVKTNDNINHKSARLHGATPADAEVSSGDEDKAELDGTVIDATAHDDEPAASPLNHAVLQKTFKRAAYISLTLCFVLMILVPMPMFGESHSARAHALLRQLAYVPSLPLCRPIVHLLQGLLHVLDRGRHHLGSRGGYDLHLSSDLGVASRDHSDR